jgi:hypothetical protein
MIEGIMTVTSALELLARMRRDAFSRNRNFDAFAQADADATRARRLWRFLRSLERDLATEPRQGVQIAVDSLEDGKRRITIDVPQVRIRRVAILSAEEYALLREHPDARAVLDAITGGH